MQTTYILLSFCLGREGPKRGVDIYSQGAAHTCAEPGPLLPLHQHHSAPLRGSGPFACKPGDGSRQHKALVREPVLPQQHISQCLCWCHQIETVRLQVLCASKTWELTAWNLLKVSPRKHLRINSPFPPTPPSFLGFVIWVQGYGKYSTCFPNNMLYDTWKCKFSVFAHVNNYECKP